MAQPEDDIAFLEDFRDRILRFLTAGAAPSQDPVWGSKGIFQMEQGMKDPAFRELRQDIDRMKGRAAMIVEGLGIACTFHQHPPVAVGGPIVKTPLFDLITDNRSQHDIDGGLFTGKIDDAIGRLQHAAAARAAEKVTAAMPVLPVWDLDVAVAFYLETLGFAPGARGAEFAVVERGAARILLRVGDRPARGDRGSWDAFLLTPDPDTLAGEVAAVAAPVETASALRGFTVTDPDGNRLFFGHPDRAV